MPVVYMYLKDIVLGLDYWQTIVHDDCNDNKIAYTGAIEVITECCKRLKSVYIISRAGERQRLRTLSWLAESGFHEKTGLSKDNIFFCGARHQKGIIASKLGINCFIDDRPEVMAHINKSIYRILFRPNPQDVDKFKLQHLQIACGWDEIRKIIFDGNN